MTQVDITGNTALVGHVDDLVDRAAVRHVRDEHLSAVDGPSTGFGAGRQNRLRRGGAVLTRLRVR